MPIRSSRKEIREPIPDLRTIEGRLTRLDTILGLVVPLNEKLLTGQIRGSGKGHPLGGLRCKPCSEYRILVNQWREALHWTPALDQTLSIMLATSLSTNLVGEQLWFKILGPPSSGKTTLLEGLAVARRYVLSKDTIRGFYSGFSTNANKDESIAGLSRGMTLATKDGDTLLKAPGREQILAEARGLYDRAGRTHYRNKVAIDYEGHRMTWLLCGTSALREIDDSEVGARFLDCIVMEEIDEDFEDSVAWRASNQEAANMRLESDGKPESHYPKELSEAMSLTGGYVEYLRKNAVSLCSQVKVSSQALRQCNWYGKFVALMRARPGIKGHAQREFSTRLVKQFTRLAIALAPVMNKTGVDSEVMERVRKVAIDTSQGIGLDITRLLAKEGGLEKRSIALNTHHDEYDIRKMLKFMYRIKVVEPYNTKIKTRYGNIRTINHWRLTTSVSQLYERVM